MGKTHSPQDQFSSQTRILSIKSHIIMLHIIYWKLLPEKVSFVITATNYQYWSSGGTMIGHIVYYVIVALCRLRLCSNLKQRITSAQSNELVYVLAGCMPAQWSSRTDRLLGWFFQSRSLTGGSILMRQRSLHNAVEKKAITVAAQLTRPHIEWSAGCTHTFWV